jgi:tetratricopeptide (TPR) repeat protein
VSLLNQSNPPKLAQPMPFTKITSALWLLMGLILQPSMGQIATTRSANPSPLHTSVFLTKKKDSKSTKHRSQTKHRAARKSQGPAREESFEEVFPPGHKFTPEEKAEASTLGVYFANSLWKDAYKLSTKSVKQHPERWWLQAAAAAAAANLNRPKDVIAAVDEAIRTNNGDANRGNLTELKVLKANAQSRLGQKSAAISTFLEAANTSPKDPYSRAGAAWIYATAADAQIRNGATAVTLATEAAKLSHEKDATILDVLAAAYAEQGNFAEAQHWEGKAILSGDSLDIPYYQRRLQSYQANKPWRENSK